MNQYSNLSEIAPFTTGSLHATTSDHFWSGSYLSACLGRVALPGDKALASIAFEVIAIRKQPHLDKVVIKGIERQKISDIGDKSLIANH